MKKLLLGIFASLSLMSSLLLPASVAVALPSAPTFVANHCENKVLATIPPWQRGVTAHNAKGECTVSIDRLEKFWRIPINVVEMMMHIAGYLALGYIIWGGFKYMKAQGNSSAIGEAKTTIINAVVGLGIVLMSVAIIRFIAAQW